MTWCDVDGAREYLAKGGGRKPSRKQVYNMVMGGMRVARLGDTGRRLMFSAEWIDEFLTGKVAQSGKRDAAGVELPHHQLERTAVADDRMAAAIAQSQPLHKR